MVLERAGRWATRGVGVVSGGRGILLGVVLLEDITDGLFRNLGSAVDDMEELFELPRAVVVVVADVVMVMTGSFIAQMA